MVFLWCSYGFPQRWMFWSPSALPLEPAGRCIDAELGRFRLEEVLGLRFFSGHPGSPTFWEVPGGSVGATKIRSVIYNFVGFL